LESVYCRAQFFPAAGAHFISLLHIASGLLLLAHSPKNCSQALVEFDPRFGGGRRPATRAAGPARRPCPPWPSGPPCACPSLVMVSGNGLSRRRAAKQAFSPPPRRSNRRRTCPPHAVHFGLWTRRRPAGFGLRQRLQFTEWRAEMTNQVRKPNDEMRRGTRKTRMVRLASPEFPQNSSTFPQPSVDAFVDEYLLIERRPEGLVGLLKRPWVVDAIEAKFHLRLLL